MHKYQVWACDECGKEAQSDGYPKEWIQIDIRKGDYFHSDESEPEIEKDCCSQECANKVVLDYYSAHR